MGTLIAGAGIFSLAVGLGAQGFVSDIVSGFFLSFQNNNSQSVNMSSLIILMELLVRWGYAQRKLKPIMEPSTSSPIEILLRLQISPAVAFKPVLMFASLPKQI